MSQSKTTSNGAESDKALAKFESVVVLRAWQQSAKRTMRANELMVRGLMDVARKQMELGQALMQSRFATMQSVRNGETLTATTSFAKAHAENNRKEVQQMIANMHEVTDDLKKCFSSATKALFDSE
jgi:hypothetical protein